MAHVDLLRTNERANEIRTAARGHRVALDSIKTTLKAHVSVMTQMLTGSSSDAASFAVVRDSYGLTSTAAAKLLFDEAAAASADNASLDALKQFSAIVG